MKPASTLLLIYLGYAAGSLQVLAFKDKYEILGILLAVSIVLVVIAGAVHGARKPVRTIPKRASRVARRNVRVAR
jgi:membrane protein DedA with SNARE-associated domain